MSEHARSPAAIAVERRGSLLILISAAAFGIMPVFAKLAYGEGEGPKTLLALRFSIAAAGLWLLWAVAYARGERVRLTWRVLAAIIAMGAIGYVGQSFAYFTAISRIPASTTGLLLYTYPVLVTLLARLIYKEPLTRLKVVALVIAGAGALLVLGSNGGAVGSNVPLDPEGIAWGLSAAIFYSGYIIAGTRFTSGVNPIFASAVIVTAAAVVYVVWGAALGEINLEISIPALIWSTLIALLSTVVAIAAFVAGLPQVGPSRAAIMSTIEPAVTVGLSALVLHEVLSLGQVLGGVLILTAVLILQGGSLWATTRRNRQWKKSKMGIEGHQDESG